METKRVTIHDVAKAAGVSIATVSRVVNNTSTVEPETAARVRRAVKQIGYIPDPLARGMRSNKSYAVGYIVSDISNGHFTVAAKAVEDELERAGYSLIVCSTDGDARKEERQLRLLVSKKVDGIIINVSGDNDAMVAELSKRVPMVLFSRQIDGGFNGDYVGNDNFNGAGELARHVLEYGHRRIGLIRGPENISTGPERYNGFVSVLAAAGVSLPPEMVFTGDYYNESGREGARTLLSRPDPPTILVAMNNAMSLGALGYIKEQALRIPDEVSFAGYGDIFNRDLLYINPTMVSQDAGRVGKLAGELILRRIADKGATPMNALVPSELRMGNSVRRINI
ncbi:MAG: LacI family transcriptional regulator [Planctomycetaceae bacterium]|nr:LacI family transcriptional regulator [Planctomycetaceae bacterium]